MSLFRDPIEHAANPPATWRVERSGYVWRVTTKDGTVLSTGDRTKTRAIERCERGFFVTLYAKEARWYAGEQVSGWKPYREVTA
jgi:hypothetical protein